MKIETDYNCYLCEDLLAKQFFKVIPNPFSEIKHKGRERKANDNRLMKNNLVTSDIITKENT